MFRNNLAADVHGQDITMSLAQYPEIKNKVNTVNWGGEMEAAQLAGGLKKTADANRRGHLAKKYVTALTSPLAFAGHLLTKVATPVLLATVAINLL